jgi:hypothetical protein
MERRMARFIQGDRPEAGAELAMDKVVIARDSERLLSDRPLAIGRKRHKTECAL